MNFTGTGWYLIPNTRSNTWFDMKIAEGFITCSVYEYIYILSGSPVPPNTSLSINNWVPIDVRGSNNPTLLIGQAYWINITEIPLPSFIIGGTVGMFSGTGTINSQVIINMIQSSGYNQTDIQTVTSIRFIGFNRIDATGLSRYNNDTSVSLGLPSLLTIRITSSVKMIGDNAFKNDLSSVTSIIFEHPCQITSIGNSSLGGLTGLTSFTIPTSVTTLGLSALSGIGSVSVSGLSNIMISDNLTTIGGLGAYMRTPGYSVYSSNPNFSQSGGVLFNKDMTTLVQYPSPDNEVSQYNIPSSVTTIGPYAFYAANIVYIVIPNTVKTIREYAFADSPTNRSRGSFVLPDSITYIGQYAFKNMLYVFSFYIPPTNSFYKTDGGVLFNHSMTTLIQFPSLSGLSTYTIANSVVSIEGYAFSRANANAWWNTSIPILRTVNLSNNLVSIGEYAFANTQISTCNLTGNVRTIGDFAFYHSYISSVIFPVSTEYIGTNAYNGLAFLSSITFSAGSTIQTIGATAFNGNNTTLNIPYEAAIRLQNSSNPPSIFNGITVTVGQNINVPNRDFYGAYVTRLNVT